MRRLRRRRTWFNQYTADPPQQYAARGFPATLAHHAICKPRWPLAAARVHHLRSPGADRHLVGRQSSLRSTGPVRARFPGALAVPGLPVDRRSSLLRALLACPRIYARHACLAGAHRDPGRPENRLGRRRRPGFGSRAVLGLSGPGVPVEPVQLDSALLA